jgi:hypothetical protein
MQQDRMAATRSHMRSHSALDCADVRNRWPLGDTMPMSAARQFFFAPKYPLEAAAMDREPEGPLEVRQ